LQPVQIAGISKFTVTLVADTTPEVKMDVTQVQWKQPVPWTAGTSFTLHVDPFQIGGLTRPAKTEITLADVTPNGTLTPPVPPLGPAPAGGEVILLGARKQGALLSGTITEAGGAGYLAWEAGAKAFAEPLVAPVQVFGNVVEVVRGETVIDEVLGSGDGAKPFNRFTLKKQPLTWIDDSAQADGRRPELTVRVENIEWQRIDTFFGAKATDRVYIVRQDEQGAATVCFGDGVHGARVPTGVNNVRATYRYGAGAAKPPPGAINQIAVPVKGLESVRGPLPALGGAAAEMVEELRVEAPRSALTLGRVVSLADFEAMARTYSGVVNATAGWSWDGPSQRAAVTLWIIADGADPSDSLAVWLAGHAAPGLTIAAKLAGKAEQDTMAITLKVRAGHAVETVRAAVHAALFDRRTGLLAPANIGIGQQLFRSVLNHRLHCVAGVEAVVSILFEGIEMPYAVGPGTGKWFDLEDGTTIL
jgi:predicted phage baseplate assembly protein